MISAGSDTILMPHAIQTDANGTYVLTGYVRDDIGGWNSPDDGFYVIVKDSRFKQTSGLLIAHK